ncbi:MAG: indole-3-glycerol phosphate synthase TrpC [Bacteroidales bacterium]|nr:indole-3-glycerol phosphate synthase TrpC [Candidatus Cryptobacteroides caccocaballi]
MKDILTEIVADKRLEVEAARSRRPLDAVREAALAAPRSTRSMRAALASSPYGIISEFKRKSPSKGWIHEDADPMVVIPAYQASGASALSILTDSKYFGGCQDFIRRIRPQVDIPILRKDFIIDEYQLYEAREIGADAVLLIAACLSVDECRTLIGKAHELGLEVLLETHSPEEMEYAGLDADMVGINNRNLGTFHTDIQNSFDLADALRANAIDKVLVSESGISDPAKVRALRQKGFKGFLMGENFMKHEDPGKALKEFIAAL